MDAIRLLQIPKIGRKIGQKYGNFEKFSNFCLKNHTFWQFLTLATYPHLSTSQNGLIYIFIVNIFFAMIQNVKSIVWSNCEKIDKIAKSDIEISNRNLHRKRNRHFWLTNLNFYYCTYNKGQSMQVWRAIDFTSWFYEVLKCSRTKKNTLYKHSFNWT